MQTKVKMSTEYTFHVLIKFNGIENTREKKNSYLRSNFLFKFFVYTVSYGIGIPINCVQYSTIQLRIEEKWLYDKPSLVLSWTYILSDFVSFPFWFH